jgi:regulator of sigma E protease
MFFPCLYLFASGFKAELPLIGSHTFFGVTQTTKSDVFINGVAKDSPAEKADIPALALLKTVNGKEIKTVSEFTSVIKEDAGSEVILTLLDSESKKMITRKVTPRKDPPKGQGALGVTLFAADTAVLAYDTPVQKIFSGFIHPANLMVYNLDIFAKLARVAIEKKDAAPLSEGVAGPVGIYSVVGTIVQIPDIKERSLQLLNLAGLLSISLAFFNVLPIPALDGGRLFFIVIEAITRRKVNAKFETVVHSIGMAVLLLLIVLVTFKDVFQFIL